MNLNEAFAALIYLCTGLGAIGAVAILLVKAVRPVTTMRKDIDKLASQFKAFQENAAKADADICEGIGMICRCLLTVLRHMETGNCTGEIRESRQEMEGYLTKF